MEKMPGSNIKYNILYKEMEHVYLVPSPVVLHRFPLPISKPSLPCQWVRARPFSFALETWKTSAPTRPLSGRDLRLFSHAWHGDKWQGM
jgi:hypothetical protein